ncbi:Hypothetical_protein [Hexamita inflata]|uniref:Hypothetical_protein n=1 Tax=Hexamita inflata TaxID=28002 RepID=A0AA86U8X1_9EUKA|nr:Hypothetical protein HINF_LOCUS29642 [Hexamita inflata]
MLCMKAPSQRSKVRETVKLPEEGHRDDRTGSEQPSTIEDLEHERVRKTLNKQDLQNIGNRISLICSNIFSQLPSVRLILFCSSSWVPPQAPRQQLQSFLLAFVYKIFYFPNIYYFENCEKLHERILDLTLFLKQRTHAGTQQHWPS